LFYAIEFKIDNLVPLLPTKENIDLRQYGQTALHVAARCGAINTAKELLTRGACIELKSSDNMQSLTALHYAAEGGHAEMIKLLLSHGASPHARSGSQSTPFYRAARSGSIEALKALYHAGSDINALSM
jgi:ankyrin repeat protein